MIDETTCIVCCDDGANIELEHICGTWYLHQNCLEEWLRLHPNECIICREKFMNNFKIINSNNTIDRDILKHSINNCYDGCILISMILTILGCIITLFGLTIILDYMGVFRV